MGICFNHIYFRPKISAACFKISFSILSCWFSFRSRISSSCSGVRLSFSWKEPELDACFTHLSNREVAMSYSRQISHLRLPERYSSTSCCLNSSVYLRGFRRCFCSVIKSAPSCIYYRLYDLKKSVQLIVTYPLPHYNNIRSFYYHITFKTYYIIRFFLIQCEKVTFKLNAIIHSRIINLLLLYKVIVFLYLFYRFDYAILRYCGLVFPPTTRWFI